MNRSQAELQRTIRDLRPWFHNLHLPGGLQTCPDHVLGDFPARKWKQISAVLPRSMDGRSVLDIGCNAGFYSFTLASRGAKVTAIDTEPHYLRQADWARRVLSLEDRVELRRQSIYELARTDVRFDLVLFLGVFYHLRYPLLGLDIVSRLVGGQLLFQTMTTPGEEVDTDLDGIGLTERERLLGPGWPRMSFIEGELANDPTNWWCPNHACVEAMLRSTGLSPLRVAHEIYLCEPDPDGASNFWRWDRGEYEAATGWEGAST